MKTLREVKEIDMFLVGDMDPPSRLVFEARVVLDPSLKLRVRWQSRLYMLIRRSARRQLKADIECISHQLFSDPLESEFQREIFKLFSKT
jgi:hypothetical protein